MSIPSVLGPKNRSVLSELAGLTTEMSYKHQAVRQYGPIFCCECSVVCGLMHSGARLIDESQAVTDCVCACMDVQVLAVPEVQRPKR